ncbi:hypothetical protein OIU74_020128, partial [Salix koriyanagi]
MERASAVTRKDPARQPKTSNGHLFDGPAAPHDWTVKVSIQRQKQLAIVSADGQEYDVSSDRESIFGRGNHAGNSHCHAALIIIEATADQSQQ